MLLTIYRVRSDHLNVVNPLSDGNHRRKPVLGIIKNQDYVQVLKEIAFCLHLDTERII